VQPKRKSGPRFVLLGGIFALCALVSWHGLGVAQNNHNRTRALAFALTCGFSSVAAVLSVEFPLMRRVERSHRRKATDVSAPCLGDGEYIAKFSSQERATLIVLLGAFALLTVLLWTHSSPLYLRYALAGMLLLLVWAVCQSFTTVRFTNEEITARVFPFRPYSEAYSNIASVQAYPRKLRLNFADGKKLDLWPGLGDPATITAILASRVEV
jgi:hypothetical protein